MITDLQPVEHQIKPGRSPQATPYTVNNFRYHNVFVCLASQMFWLLETRSNNMKAAVNPDDIRTLISGHNFMEFLWQKSLENNDPPGTLMEQGQQVWFPSQRELMLIPNMKVRLMNLEYDRVWRVMIGSDAANSGGNIDTVSQSQVTRQMRQCKDFMTSLFGSGVDNTDTGVEVPRHLEVGTIAPALTGPGGELREPSPDAPNGPFPDVPDTQLQI